MTIQYQHTRDTLAADLTRASNSLYTVVVAINEAFRKTDSGIQVGLDIELSKHGNLIIKNIIVFDGVVTKLIKVQVRPHLIWVGNTPIYCGERDTSVALLFSVASEINEIALEEALRRHEKQGTKKAE